MSENGIAARPYAHAAFDLAREGGQLDAWSKILALGAQIAASDDVGRALIAPGGDLDALALAIADICREQLGNPAPLTGGASALAVNFFRVLAQNRRLAALPDISQRFDELKAEAENVLDVTLTSAIPVAQEQQARIVASLGKRFGRTIRLAVSVDGTLIGGARLQVGDRVIDGSVRTGLDKLATALRT